MTARAPAWFERKYVRGLIQKLQSAGWLLRGAVNSTGTIKGNEVVWKTVGTGTATQMSTAIEDRPTMNADRGNILATMADYEANDWILSTDLEKMPENEQQVSQQTGAMAMGRKFDSLILGEMDAQAGAITTIGDGTAAISIVDLMDAQQQIADQGMGSYNWWVALPVKWLAQLGLYREFSSSDYVGDEYPLLRKLGARRYLGMNIVPIPSAFLNVPAANQADGYVWLQEYMGFAPNYNLISRIDYVAQKKAYFAGNTMGMAQKVLDTNAFRRLRFATNVALARPTP